LTGLSVGFDLEAYLSQERDRVEEALDRAVDALADFVSDPSARAIRHGVLGGGKRLRPILCAAAYRASGGTAEEALYDLAASLELVHAYSLMHDDLPCMDDAELRRGRPTTWVAHGDRVALEAGVALIPLAALYALRACTAMGCDVASSRRATRALLEAAGAGGMVGGQWLDLRAEGRLLAEEALDELHRRKTGALLAASLTMGAIAAGASEGRARAVETYGRRIGLAFQITDDVLDATQSAETLGKHPSDAALDKSTYVSVHGIDAARARAEREVEGAVSALRSAGVEAPPLEALARYVVGRDR